MNTKNQGFIEAITQLSERVKELEQENMELQASLADAKTLIKVRKK
jgi:exonuclease VII small subunit